MADITRFDDAEFYGQFIRIRGKRGTVLIFSEDEPESEQIAQEIAKLLDSTNEVTLGDLENEIDSLAAENVALRDALGCAEYALMVTSEQNRREALRLAREALAAVSASSTTEKT